MSMPDVARGLYADGEDAAPGGLRAGPASRPGRSGLPVTTPVAVAPSFIE